MKKIIFAFVILFFASFLYADGLNGFYGVPFGASEIESIQILSVKGWEPVDQQPERIRFSKKNGTFAGLQADDIVLFYFDNKLYRASVSFQSDDIAVPYSRFKEVCDAIVKKYELIQNGNPNTFIDGERNEFYAVLYKKASDGYLLMFTDTGLYEWQKGAQERLRKKAIEADI